MKKPIREISEQEIISLGQRIDQAVSLGQGSTPEDLPLLRDIFDTWWLIADEVKDETLTLKGLREIFGIIKEKLNKPGGNKVSLRDQCIDFFVIIW